MDRVLTAAQTVPTNALQQMIEKLKDLNKSRVFIVGNGGSAAIASHFATDLIRTYELNNSNSEVFSLVDNSPLVLASANDFGFDNVFSRQVAQLSRRGDTLIAISSSGSSENVIRAVQKARSLEVFCIGLTGFNGGKLKDLVDISIHVTTNIGQYQIVEDVHSSICHYVSLALRS